MIRLALLTALVLPAVGLAAPPASAQRRVVYPYCVQDTFAGTITCSFRTMGECLASRNSPNDTCISNPEWERRPR